MRLLKIDTSTRMNDSHSRRMAKEFLEKWKVANPNGQVVSRDLALNGIPHVSQDVIDGMYLPKEKQTPATTAATEISRRLIAEIKNCDILVISTPMFNFGIPSVLKAYIDQISWPGELFEVKSDGSLAGLMHGKKAYVFTAAGAAYSGGPFQSMDFTTTYLERVLGFFGFSTEVFSLEGSTIAPNVLEKTTAEVRRKISKMF